MEGQADAMSDTKLALKRIPMFRYIRRHDGSATLDSGAMSLVRMGNAARHQFDS